MSVEEILRQSGTYKREIKGVTTSLYASKRYDYNFKDENLYIDGYGYYDSEKPQPYRDNRYLLRLTLNGSKGGKTLTAIMMNPSNTFPAIGDNPATIDPSVLNVCRIAYRLGNSEVVVLNSFPLIHGGGKNAIKSVHNKKETNEKNLMVIDAYINEGPEMNYLIAWGGSVQNESFLRDKLKGKETYAYRLTKKDKKPCHPSIRVENRWHYVSEFLNNPVLMPIKL